ncbi:MAG: dihydrofolate reductase [Bacteroidetes bacterium]|jgi:dihydrofolate reductase|nr:dihydrofolate reductase [Bacteroidota bacterium]MBT3749980.1 dihydrofolate reductase [Bacteroidota bacterium]MBT4400021.1 dihydrofolate reductase [Bacteroidota bacterium]MBT4408475.1 dihydrofolate reductase [Bacteroidota bacterium]MBT5426812.1 dihydrofolate reductase [Bacteroidota bacterium]
MKKISIIVATASNWAIGKDNDLLWHISGDMKWFKKQTSGHPVVMGKLTWDSLPIRPLPKRTNIVLTDNPDDILEGCEKVYSITEAVERMDDTKENFIIGGGSVYKQFLPMAQKLYLTQVHKHYDADTFFPEINFDEWTELYREDHSEAEIPHSYLILER